MQERGILAAQGRGESAAAWGLGNGKVRQRWGAVAWGTREVLAVVERWWWS